MIDSREGSGNITTIALKIKLIKFLSPRGEETGEGDTV
jgi:hypothetical protein